VRELKTLLLADEELLARNLVRQLAVYATGAPVRFSDRAEVAKILARSKSDGLRRADVGPRDRAERIVPEQVTCGGFWANGRR